MPERRATAGRRRILRPLRLAACLATVLAAAALTGCSSGSSSQSGSAGAATGGTATGGSWTGSGASGFDGAALPLGVRAPSLRLRDQTGASVSLSDYASRVVIVAIVYSTCGSPCVVIGQQIRGALDELTKPVPVLLISADPRADTRARVKRFLAQVSLSGRARYLTGSEAQLRLVWHAFRVPGASAGQAAFARSASVFLVDGKGDERVIYQLEQLTPEALSHDVRKLLG